MKLANWRDDVLYAAAHELSVDVTSIDFSKDLARQYTAFGNRHLKNAYELFDWPELNLTEERAFRNIWNDSKQFYRVNTGTDLGQLFYIPNMTYYDVVPTAGIDPPIGTLPTNTTYFTPTDLTTFERYIAYEQTCQRTIGELMGIYNGNPNLFYPCWNVPCINYKPNEKGIQVRTSNPTVFVRYRTPPSVFTSEPWNANTTYQKGHKVYWNYDGNCYKARITVPAGHVPSSSTYWSMIQLPDFLAQYVALKIAGNASEDVATKGSYDNEAILVLGREIDKRIEQGQKWPTYNLGFPRRYPMFDWIESLPFCGSSTVTTLTDICYDEDGGEEVNAGDEEGIATLISGQDYIDVTFVTPKLATGYNFEVLALNYPTNPPPEKVWIGTPIKSLNGFRVYLNSAPTDALFTLSWRITV